MFLLWGLIKSPKGILEDDEKLFSHAEVLISHHLHLGDECENEANVDENDEEHSRIFERLHDVNVVASELLKQQESVKES